VVARFAEEKKQREEAAKEEQARKPQKENIESMLPLDLVELEVGYGLINIVESDQSGDLLERIVSIRKQFALDMGIVVPSVHIRDNLQLQPGEYRVLIKGNKVGGGALRPENLLAMDPGNVTNPVPGVPTKEPAFGLDALWIGKGQKEEAEIAGYTVVDLPTVMATHLTEILRTHAHELFGRQEADSLIENFKKNYPKVVQELVPDVLPLGTVVKVLQNLLREQVSIRDLLTIFETLADEGNKSKDAEVLTENVRKALARAITHKYMNEAGEVAVMTLAPKVEEMVSNSLLQTEQGVQLVMDPRQAQSLLSHISQTIEQHPEIAGQPILLTSPTSRRHIFKLTNRFLPQVIVLSHNEISSDAQIQAVGLVEMGHAG
jgi:flagellar biosynthesis protein FlhA